MTHPVPVLNHLLRTEHILLSKSLAEARNEKELQAAAEGALAFASLLLAERESESGAAPYNAFGVSFWAFPNLARFGRDWPTIAQGELGHAPVDGSEVDPILLVEPLRAAGFLVLGARSEDCDEYGQVLVIDSALVNEAQIINLLFALALHRLPKTREIAAIVNEGQSEDRTETLTKICTIIIDSEEAQKQSSTWSAL